MRGELINSSFFTVQKDAKGSLTELLSFSHAISVAWLSELSLTLFLFSYILVLFPHNVKICHFSYLLKCQECFY